MSAAMMSAAPTSSTEAGTAEPRSASTERWVRIDTPQSPDKIPPK